MRHWLAHAHQAMIYAHLGHLWLPGSTTWRHYATWDTEEAERRAIRRAQAAGYLSRDTGIPQLTRRGYQRY